jgi:hypothetical protein
MNRGIPPDVRFRMKYRVSPSGCWEWTGSDTGKGHKLRYGRFRPDSKGRLLLAHRYAYERFVGPIPEGLELDRLCRNTLCVNPEHLEPVTRRVNVLRGTSPNAANRAKTHCKHGHELTQENCYAYRWPRNRQCKTCAQDHSRKTYAKIRVQPCE